MTPLLLFGFLLGVRHALEADHVAAVAALAARSSSRGRTMRLAATWGLGHAASLLVFGGTLLVLGLAVPRGLEHLLEGLVGVTLVVLGLDVLRRLRRGRIHFHVHEHPGHPPHFHGHSHAAAPKGVHGAHDHAHPPAAPRRAFLVGALHGLAGTAGLTILALEPVAARAPATALAGLALFGVGSTLGMVLFSLALTVPLELSARRLRWGTGAIEAAVGTLGVVLGAWIAVGSALGR